MHGGWWYWVETAFTQTSTPGTFCIYILRNNSYFVSDFQAKLRSTPTSHGGNFTEPLKLRLPMSANATQRNGNENRPEVSKIVHRNAAEGADKTKEPKKVKFHCATSLLS